MSGFGNKNPWDNHGRGGGGGGGGYGNYNQQQMGGMNQGPQMGISYPAPRSQQNSGFGGQMQNQGGQQGGAGGQGNRVFTGNVTKLHDNFGFVDDDVFFQMNVCKGANPRVGDRVLVEAVYNANMPFKWNATRITTLPGGGGGAASGPNSLLGAGGGHTGGGHTGGSRFGDRNSQGGGGNNRGFGGGDRPGLGFSDRAPRNRSPRRDDKKRDVREQSSRKRSRSRSKTRSPPRRRARHLPRYNVSVPKVILSMSASTVMELKKRYNSLYIPSDFFKANHVWNEAFPLQAPFNIRHPSTFTVMNRELVEPVIVNKFQYDPADADYTYVAKVMLLAAPQLEDLYEKTCHLIEKDSEDKDPRDGLVHPSRALKFLIGLKGKSETMAIGGPWSPSLDGADPVNDPGVLIKTAIRTCGAMTGIDLSKCTQWTKFTEIHYRRQASSTKPARTETVVMFFPDVWSAMPNKIEYDASCELYVKNLALKLEGKPIEPIDPEVDMDATVNEEDEEVAKKADPTPWKELDPKTMKVNDLKGELEARGQSSKGLKSQLQARLQKCIQTEEEEEKKAAEGEEAAVVEETAAVAEPKEGEETEESKELDEKTKEKLEKAYKTPTAPCLLIHPNTKVKSGKFDCKVESLSVLLDYRSDDNKEGTFELSLFAELFNEMMMRDNAFKLYRAVANAPEKPKEVKDDKKDKEDKEKDEKEKDVKEVVGDEEKKNMITRNKELLYSASYFDLSHIGYFEAKDLEDILLTLELELSRAEVKKLVAKLKEERKDHVNYRALTDVEVGAPEKEAGDVLTDKELASGFKQYVPGCSQQEGATGAAQPTTETNKLVKFRGSVLDIEKLVEKMDKAESVRTQTDSKLVTIQKELNSCKSQSDKFLAQRDKLATELKASRDKVKTLEGEKLGARGESAKYLAALKDVLYRVQPLAAPPAPPKKEEPVEDKPVVNGTEKKEEEEKVEEKEEKMETTEAAAEVEETKTPVEAS